MVIAEQVLTLPAVLDHDAKRLAHCNSVWANIGPGPSFVAVVPALHVMGRRIEYDGPSTGRAGDHDREHKNGKDCSSHVVTHSATALRAHQNRHCRQYRPAHFGNCAIFRGTGAGYLTGSTGLAWGR